MSLLVGHLHLYSQKPTELAHFFSELLDMDIVPDQKGGGIWLKNSDLTLFVDQASAEQLFHKGGERDMMVEFQMSSLNELEDLLHKVQFIGYRQGDGEVAQGPKVKLSRIADKVFFNLKDPDGRRWKFSFSEAAI